MASTGQVAKLFARGRLMNVTARNLTPDQQREVDALWLLVWEDSALQTQQREFCMALGRIIGGEYRKDARDWKDLGAQMSELSFAFWRACVDVLYHNPKPEVVENRVARLKYFKTHMFNYLRQILNENKIPVHKETKRHVGQAHHVTKRLVMAVFGAETKNITYDLEEDATSVIFHINTRVLSNKILKKIWHIRDKVVQFGVTVATHDDSIWIYSATGAKLPDITLAVTDTTKLKFVSDAHVRTSGDADDNGFNKHVEFVAAKQGSGVEKHATSTNISFRDKEAPVVEGVITQDIQETLMSRLDPHAREILTIQLTQPKDFVDRYFPNRKKEITHIKSSQLADYLGLTKDEVDHKRELIKMEAAALDLAPAGVDEE